MEVKICNFLSHASKKSSITKIRVFSQTNSVKSTINDKCQTFFFTNTDSRTNSLCTIPFDSKLYNWRTILLFYHYFFLTKNKIIFITGAKIRPNMEYGLLIYIFLCSFIDVCWSKM